MASRLEFHLLNRPLCQLRSRLVNPVHNLARNLRLHRQLRHRVSLLLLHRANQVRNLRRNRLDSHQRSPLASPLVSPRRNHQDNHQLNRLGTPLVNPL